MVDVVDVVVVVVVFNASSRRSNFSLVSFNSFCKLVFCTARTMVETVNAVRAKPNPIETTFAVIIIVRRDCCALNEQRGDPFSL